VSPAALSQGARPGRQRSAACDASILSATLELLNETGYAGLTVAAVIERSGVSSATLYRRWTTKQQLVVAAVATLVPEPVDTDTGSFAGDLTAFIEHIAQSISLRHEGVSEALSIERRRNPELDVALRERFLAPRLAELRSILARAKRRGEVDGVPPAEIVLSLVVGPLHHRAYQLGEPLTREFIRAETGFALRALQR
jgi:AcrR family transcriptional regulator